MARTPLYVLDDDEQYSQLISTFIQSTGLDVVTETSAVHFLKSPLPQKFILILDLIMPEMDGIEVIRELATKNTQASLILVSGFDERVLHSAQLLAEAYKMEVLACFTKPIDPQLFIDFIAKLSFQLKPSKPFNEKNKLTASELNRAITNQQLVVHYQAQVDVKTNILIGLEALVRVNHPTEGLIYPDRFIQVAEDNNLMAALTKNVISSVCRDLASHQEAFKNTIISINISSKDIISLKFPELLISLVEENNINPKQVCLELTETAVMGELTASLDVLNRLRMKGFSLSIDDFGTGHSSLTQLYNAPFSELKIDQHFVMRMENDKEAKVIVEICIMLGHMMGMKVVAEGVETYEIAKTLTNLTCDVLQGYFIAKPLSLKDILNFMDKHHEIQSKQQKT
jgi:EAL domain-containing protein (putative c-di-GMP-specific phosphodiesterase class I)/ActR/RegA family two-component response regulator